MPFIIIYFSALLFTFPNLVMASAIFEDDFQNEAVSSQNWLVVSDNDSGLIFREGMANLENSSISNSAMAIHNIYQNITTFSLSGKVSSQFPGAGLCVCITSSSQGISGYAVITGNGSVHAYKYRPGNAEKIFSKNSSFVKEDENLLTISKEDSRITVFCNGYYVFSFVDTEYVRGDIALLVQPFTTASFDNIIFQQDIQDSLSYECFDDNFSDTASFGWSNEGSGKLQRIDSSLTLITNAYQELYTGINIPIDVFNLRVSARYISGSTGSLYGLMVRTTGESSGVCRFGVTADGRYAIESDSGEPVFQDISSLTGKNIGGESPDMLELRMESGYLFFLINGDALDTISADLLYAGVGMFISNDLEIRFDNFELIDPQECIPPVSVYRVPGRGVPFLRDGIKLDLLGRVYRDRIIGIGPVSGLIFESGIHKPVLKIK